MNVDAEGDGRGSQRTLSSPNMRRRLALAWPAILGICIGGLVVAALAAAVFARRRTRRAYQVRPCRGCWPLLQAGHAESCPPKFQNAPGAPSIEQMASRLVYVPPRAPLAQPLPCEG